MNVCVLPTCVCPNVSLKQPGSGESLATEFTHTGQCVCPDVHLEGSQADVLLLTVLTAEVLLTAPLTLELLVFGQAREAQVLPMTVQTLKALLAAAAGRDGWKEGQEREGWREEALSPPVVSCDTLEFQVHFAKGLCWFVGFCMASAVRF